MSTGLLIFLIAVSAVAFFVTGLSLTIIFKGRYMDSEIGDNKHMKARGIQCAAQQMRREEASLCGCGNVQDGCSEDGCRSCALPGCEKSEKD